MADNFDFDGSIFEDQNNTQPEGYTAPEAADAGSFGAEDSYGDFYTPDAPSQDVTGFEDAGAVSDDIQPGEDEPQDEDGYDDYEERGIRAFLGSIGKRSKILLIAAVVLLLVFLIILLASGRKAKNNNNTPVEPVSIPAVVEVPSDVPVTVPTESQTVQLSGGLGTYTVDTGDNTLALRPNASTDYDAIVRLKSGTVVEVLFVDDFSNEGEAWGYIVYEGQAGWVNMEYLAAGNVEVTTAQSSLG